MLGRIYQERRSRACESKKLVTRLVGLTLFIGAFGLAPASANSIVLTKATVDWTAFSFTVSGGLTVDSVVYSSQGSTSSASTSGGGTQGNNGRDSAASSSYANGLGAATATASSVNGVETSSSRAETLTNSSSKNTAFSLSDASSVFWLYGHGTGYLTVSVPYNLTLQVIAGTKPGVFVDDYGTASAIVWLMLGPGTGWYASDSLSWSSTVPLADTSLTKSGTLTLSRAFNNPAWGPLVSIDARATTQAVAAVPEPDELVLLGSGLFGLLLLGISKSKAVRTEGRETADLLTGFTHSKVVEF